MTDLAHIPGPTLALLEELLPADINETLRDVAISLYMHMIEEPDIVETLGLDRIADIAAGQVDRVSLECGGRMFYMPKGVGQRNSPRDQAIIAEYNGRNKRELGRKHGLSDMRIEQIVNKPRKQEQQKRKEDFLRAQGNLALGD